MGVSKVEFAGNTLIDLTGDTVQPTSLVAGYTATNASGEKIEGEFIPIYFGDEDGIESAPLNADTLGGYTAEQLMANSGGSVDLQTVFNAIYPVGSIYMSVNNVSPATLFGGVWEQIKDTFLLASGSSYALGSTGGEASHTLTVNEMPKHNHKSMMWRDGGNQSFGVNDTGKGSFRFSFSVASSDDNIYTDYAGGNASHNNMPPYLTVNVWKRTA